MMRVRLKREVRRVAPEPTTLAMLVVNAGALGSVEYVPDSDDSTTWWTVSFDGLAGVEVLVPKHWLEQI